MRYTLILFPQTGDGSVRRWQVKSQWFWWGGLMGLVAAMSLVGLGAELWRTRGELRELAQLRSERSEQSAALQRYGARFSEVEGELARVHELERKLRLITDLPEALPEVAPPPGVAKGVGGGAEPRSAERARDREERAAVVARGAALARRMGQAGAASLRSAALDPRRAGALALAADALGARLERRAGALSQLSEQLERKHERLAATPSIWPTRGRVTSRFGSRTSPFTGARQHHPGLDIATRVGTPIVAPARGRVHFSGVRGALGRSVVLDHGYGVRTLFGHARELLVKEGERVERGQPIASVGSTGRSTGPHLHYGVEVRGRAVDPADYLLN